jgi:hypothetical protein
MADLSISNVLVVSVAEAGAGLNAFNTGNLLLVTDETPDPVFTDDYKIYKEPSEVALDFGSDSLTYACAANVFSQSMNVLTPGGALIVAPLEASETLNQAYIRLNAQIQFFGFMSTVIQSQVDMLAVAASLQASSSPKIGFFPDNNPASVEPAGALDKLRTGNFSRSRGLFYVGTGDDAEAVGFAAAYASRLFGVDFSGSNTVLNMHLKDLSGVQPDSGMTQTLLGKAQAAGADVYPSIQGLPKVFTSGANAFVDQVQNLSWFVAAIQVAVFNYLAQTATKIPQTEAGMDGMKGAIREVCKQAVTNGYVAPGRWSSPDVFGNTEDLKENILQHGYYIYSAPISDQLQVDRAARKAPLCQVAIKEAGAINSASVTIYVNA